jgi:hypothetical protein
VKLVSSQAICRLSCWFSTMCGAAKADVLAPTTAAAVSVHGLIA